MFGVVSRSSGFSDVSYDLKTCWAVASPSQSFYGGVSGSVSGLDFSSGHTIDLKLNFKKRNFRL